MKARAITTVVILLLLASHPLWLISLVVDWEGLIGPGAFALNATAVGWIVDTVVLAGTVQRMERPLPRLEDPSSTVPHRETHSGFSLTVRASDMQIYRHRAILGVIVSTAGMAAYAFLWAVTHEIPTIPWPVFALVNVAVHAVASTAIFSLVAIARWRQQTPGTIELDGRLLRTPQGSLAIQDPRFEPIETGMIVHTDGGSLEVHGPDDVVRWIRRQLLALEDRGTQDEVPTHLRDLTAEGAR